MNHPNNFSMLFVLSVLVVFLNTNAGASHIRTGKVTKDGEVETNEGLRHYTTEAFLVKPIVCWEDLLEDGLIVDQCTSKKLRFDGNIDEDDFKKGNVLTFPVEDYVSFGCPLPPHSSKEKDPGVIFRRIQSAEIGDGQVIVRTTFIDPGKVVPTILLHMGELVNSGRQVVDNTTTGALELLTTSRVNNIGVRDFQRRGSLTPFTRATISYSITASGGICSFRFDIRRRQVTWEQRIDVTTTGSLTVATSLARSASGEIFKVPIPGAGFSLSIFLLGTVSAGFTAALDWEAEIEFGATATLDFTARVSEGRRVTLGIGTLNTSPLVSASSGTTGTLSFNTNVAASASAEGFSGLRPVLALELSLPVIPDATVGLGATAGLAASIGFRSPPFPATSSGLILSPSCSFCHFVQGSLDVEGRRLSIEAEAPILGDREFVIISTLFSRRLGTLCLFETTCPL